MSRRAPAGGLVFVGDADRCFRALDVRSGEGAVGDPARPRGPRLPRHLRGGGRQFVAAPTGPGIFRGLTAALNPEIHQAPTGNALCVFARPE